MRIVLIGQAAFGAGVLEALQKKGETITAVYTPPDSAGGRPDPLKEAAQTAGIPVHQPAGYKDDRTFEAFSRLDADLCILAFVTDIIPERFLRRPTHGTICYHPSILPRHRGASAINWAVIMGDTRTGLTIFWPDGGIDTGPILLQKEIAITPTDTTGSLYFNHLFPMGVAATVEAVDLIKSGRAPKIPQDEADATYEPPCDDTVAVVDFQQPWQTVFNLIRGCDPQPGAYVMHRGEPLRFYGAQAIPESPKAAAGTIIEIDESGLHIALGDARVVAAKLKYGGLKKMPAAELCAELRLAAGDRLST